MPDVFTGIHMLVIGAEGRIVTLGERERCKYTNTGNNENKTDIELNAHAAKATLTGRFLGD